MEAPVEFRCVHQRVDGQTVTSWLEYRVRLFDPVAKLLLPASPWQRMDSVQAVDQDGKPL
jgi:hypothetical protein